MKSVPLRRRLLLLVAAGLLPLAVVAAIALAVLYHQHRMQAERSVLEVARALSTAVDAELRRSVAVLQVLATSPSIDEKDLARFEDRARRTQLAQSHWRGVALFTPAGEPVMNTAVPRGAPLAGLVEPGSFEEAVRTGKPVVGLLRKGPRGAWAIPIRVPVIRDDKVSHVLTAIVDPKAINEILQRTRVPGEWVVAVSDSQGLRVARTASIEQSLGTPFSPTLVRMMRAGGPENTGVTRNSEGQEVFTAYTRAAQTGWVTAVGLPVTGVEANARQSFLTFGAGVALSIVLGAFAALFIGRSITGPMASLSEAAADARPGAFHAPKTDIREIQDVARALAAGDVERTRGEAEREELLRREQAARAVAERANRAKDEFLAMLGHELRNPLGAISNAAMLLEHAGLDEHARHEARAIISRQVGHLTRLTDDLLDAGRAIMGKIVLRRRPLDLAAVARQSLATLAASGKTRKHAIEHDLESVWVDADPIRLDQVIANLMTNAVKYSPAGGRIRVSVSRQGADAVLRVADEGVGVPSDLAPRIFDLFVQGDRELDRALGGLGIGLTLVRRLAEMHGGCAEVKSDGEGRGAEFTVRLPAIEAPASDAAPLPGMEPAPARDILIVEDNADARETLRMLLEIAGHRVAVEPDGESGLATALRSRPEVLLVDVGLPRMDGYEVARRIRSEAGWPARPLLVAITGYGQSSDREQALRAGFDAHLAKPVEPRLLLDLIARGPTSSSPGTPSAGPR
jgi:signal transduction histidine kinase/ActR/RegA family two-component response regulator